MMQQIEYIDCATDTYSDVIPAMEALSYNFCFWWA